MKFKRWATVISIVLLVIYVVWWLLPFTNPQNKEEIQNAFSLTYGVIAGFGGILGFIIASKWGGFKSYIGKSLIFFSFGLLCQFLGQNSYSIKYLIDHIENSYPSFGEIFFVVSIPSYIVGVYYIAKAAGSEFSLRSFTDKIFAVLFPLLLIGISYYLFVKDNLFEDQPLLNNLLTFTYPIGQAAFVSLAIVAYYTSKRLLGGIMKTRITLILFSLAFQYFADTLFLYKTINGTWTHADESELLFALSYWVMTYAFIHFLEVIDKVRTRC